MTIDLKALVRDVENWPSDGVIFKDITPLFSTPEAFRYMIDTFAERLDGQYDSICAMESRGFLLGSALAYKTGKPLVLIRKKGKLPGEVHRVAYETEYSKDIAEIHTDALKAGDRVVIIDDLIATGGTLQATVALIGKLGAQVSAVAAIIDLTFLGGSDQIRKLTNVVSLIEY